MLNESDDYLIYNALTMWGNYIETGTLTCSGADFARQRKTVKPLDMEQMKMLIRIRELAAKHLT